MKNHKLLLATIMFFTISFKNKIYANSQLDSLKMVAKSYTKTPSSTKKDTSFAKLLLEIGVHYDDIRLDSTKFYLDSAMRFCEKINWKKGKAYISRGFGHYYFRLGYYDKAIPYFLDLMNIAKATNDKTLEASANINLATQYVYLKMFGKAKTYFDRGLFLYKTTTNTTMYAVALANFGNSELKQGHYLKAINYLKQSLAIIQKTDNSLTKSRIVSTSNMLSVAYLNANMIDSSKIYQKKCLDLGEKIQNHQNIYDMYNGFAEFYHKKTEYAKSTFYANKALNYAEKLQSIEKQSSLFNLLYQNYNQANNSSKALQYFVKHKILEDSLIRSNVHKQIAELELTFESEKQKTEIQKLSIEKLIQSRQSLLFYLVGSFISLAIILVMYRELKKNNKALIEKNTAILEAHLKGQTTERQRVAIDLHDNLGSTISSIKYSLEAIDRSKMNADEVAVQENLYSLLDKAYNDVRLLSHNLLPEEFEKKGLTETLTEFIRKINKASKINFDLKIDENFGRQDHKIEFELYSICMELVNNIMKHSKATNAKITLSKQTPPLGAGGLMAEQIQLLVSDNGIGIFKNDSDGKGMKNIQARVDSINGKWTVKSVEGEGVVNEIVVNC
jgi:signal transduction histidine kinase